ncbi:MAG TPA: glycosyltransferase family 2 protein [Methanobacteriaceae archaeon]|nr:glycosyltransferase family 2 protein [Methanobacteriaceae archaeon]
MKNLTLIPAYNEEKTIKKVAEDAKNYSDVLVVNDGSEDHTSSEAKTAGSTVINHAKNLGKGAAIKTGLEYAKFQGYDSVVILDGDGQHDPHCIPLLLEGISQADLVIGSRFMSKAPENMPLQRRLSNKITTHIIKYTTGYHLTDSQCGFRAVTTQSIPLFLDISYNDYIFESEMICRASFNNLNLLEINITSTYGEEKSYVRTIHILHYLIFTIKILGRKIMGRIEF